MCKPVQENKAPLKKSGKAEKPQGDVSPHIPLSAMAGYDFPFLNHFLGFQKKIGAKIQDKAEIRCVTDHYLGEAVTPLDNVICADQPANSGKDEIFL